MRDLPASSRTIHLGLAVLAVLALGIELLLSSEHGLDLAYVTIILLTLGLQGAGSTLIAALSCSALILLEPVLGLGHTLEPELADRLGLVLLVWISALLVLTNKHSQRDLHASRQHLQSLYDEAPDAYATLTADGRLLSVNHTGLIALGLESFEPGINLCDHVHPQDREQLLAALATSLSDRSRPRSCEFRMRCGAEYRWISARLSASPERVGDQDEIRAICRDVQERRTADEALRSSEEHFRNLVEGSIQGIVIHRRGKPLFSNRAFARMMGFERVRDLLALDSLEVLLDPSEVDRIHDLYRDRDQLIAGITDHELIARRQDGSPIVLRILARAVNWYGRTAIQSAVIDITEYRAVHQALERNEQRFREFAEIAADWFWETDAQLRLTYISGRVQELTGCTPTEMLGQDLHQALTRDQDNPDICHLLAEDLAAHRPFRAVELPMVGERGLTRIIRSSGRPVSDAEGRFAGYRGVGRDVTVEFRMAQKVAHQATHDSLTGLVNRLEFEQRLARALNNAKQHGSRHVLCYLDLDQFKIVNDTAGHVAGDELLRQLTNVLVTRIRQRDTLARQGGDEFTLLLENCTLEKGLQVAESMVEAVSQFRFTWEGRHFDIGVSIGVVEVTAEALNTVQLLSRADAACYSAKDQGRRQVYSPSGRQLDQVDRHSEILRASELRDALEEQRFTLYCQPIYPLDPDSGNTVHLELLLRMRDTDQRLVAPGAFISAAERFGLMAAVDRWVIRAAFQHFSDPQWQDAAPPISINLSGNSLSDDSLLGYVQQQLADSRLRPQNVCFEITETAAISNLTRATHFIQALRKMGCRFALDDFGSGLSSFSYLKNLPVDYLKIDGAFVRDLVTNPIDQATVAAIHQVGHVMGIKTVAEFVETDAVLHQLRRIGVDFGQGYGLCKPVPLSEAARAIAGPSGD